MKRFNFWVKTSFILVLLILVAGSTVRMTGSGMGCPDWPKCFGFYIPPTQENQLLWKGETPYSEGQIIIVNESLRVAKQNFISSTDYDEQNWNAYTRHDYAIFNPLHTWVEYINRLVSVVAGFATLLMFYFSLKFIRKRKAYPFVSFLILASMGFQAWLGKLVVDSELVPIKISIHTVMALLIVAFFIFLLFKTTPHSEKPSPIIKRVSLLVFLITLFQISSGIGVRQFLDLKINQIIEGSFHWNFELPFSFELHRVFALIVIASNVYLFLQIKRALLSTRLMVFILGTIALEFLLGLLMYYYDIPFATQPLHLLLASILFGLQFYQLLRVYLTNQINKL